ncbi:MAG: hypothetical protein K8R57_05100 [Verrucomicrobia bacterium]|nr:hypothetical protein [Verrucomicrobiota bacterium]
MLDMARALNVPPDGVNPEIFLSDIEKKNARNLLRERFGDRKVLVIHPGCAGNTCNLPIDSYTALARRLLSSTDVGIVFSGISPEREVFVGKLSEFEGNERVWNTMGEFSLRKYCGIIEASDLVVTPSTGPLHLASALGRSTLSPFCCRAGLSKEVWGNLSAKSIVLEPPSRVCAGRNKGKYCDFQGCINVEKLLQSCIDLLAIA